MHTPNPVYRWRDFQYRGEIQFPKWLCVRQKLLWDHKDKIPKVQRVITSPPPPVMVWLGVLYSNVTQIHFRNAGVKTNGEVYSALLNNVLPSLEETVFTDENEWCFQQDSAPAHKIKNWQKWLQRACSRFHRSGWLALLQPWISTH